MILFLFLVLAALPLQAEQSETVRGKPLNHEIHAGASAALPVEALEEPESPKTDFAARPWFPEASRRMVRGLLLPESDGGPAARETEPRQHHAGPEAFSPEFTLNDQVGWYLDRFERFPEETLWVRGALSRAAPYAHFIRTKIAENGLPPEIFFLPVVESLYLVNAHSPADALGLWQFTRDSVWPWMKINDWVDERKDFWKSTEAAMEKLKLNYKYTEDWLLALAAYNCGLNWTINAVRKGGTKDFWTLSAKGLFPKETRNYIPKLIAVTRYAARLQRENPDPVWTEPMKWERIALNQAVDLRLLSKAAGVSFDMLKAGNAELIYGITPPTAMAYHLKVPASYSDKVKKALNDSEFKLLKFAIHTIQEGDTLSDLSLHFGIPVSMIQRYNPQVRPEALRLGARLIVPLYKDVGPYRSKRKAPVDEVDEPLFFANEYIVRDGDTLWDLARTFNTSTTRIARANGMSVNGILRPGMTLKVP